MNGSVRRDGSGGWHFNVDLPSADGRRKQAHRRGFATRKEAQAALDQVKADVLHGTYVDTTHLTVWEYLTGRWLPAKRSTVKASTFVSYQQTVAAYLTPRIGGVQLAKVDPSMLNALYADLLTEGRTGASGRQGGLSAKTVRNIHGILHRAFRDAVRWGLLARNPADAADQPRRVATDLLVWTPEQLGAFLETAATDRLAVVWELLATTGMRRGEVLGLRWSDLDLASRRLTISQSRTMAGNTPVTDSPKTRAGARTIALDHGTVAALRTWRKAQAEDRLLMGGGWPAHDLVVTEGDGRGVHPQVLTRRFKALAVQTGLPAIRLHDLRHSYATAALAAGVPVKVLSARLGHTDIAITLRVYAHLMPGQDVAAADLVAGLIRGAAGVPNSPGP